MASSGGGRYSLSRVPSSVPQAEVDALSRQGDPGPDVGDAPDPGLEKRARPRRGPSYARGFVLEGEPGSLRRLLGDLWHSGELIKTLARKDFFVRYRRASFGLIWSVVVPLLQATVMALIFSRFVRFSQISHYPVYVFGGIVAWQFFSGVMTVGTTSIVDGSDLSTKIYFPRAVFPLVSVGTALYALAPSVGVLLLATIAFEGVPEPRLLLLIPAVVLLTVLALGFALVLSAAYVYFRDTRFAVSAALLAWFYATPIIYPVSVTGFAEPYLRANPMTGVVELFHHATVGAGGDLGIALAWSCGWTFALCALGLALHRRFDRVFGDLL